MEIPKGFYEGWGYLKVVAKRTEGVDGETEFVGICGPCCTLFDKVFVDEAFCSQ
jgi:hypothetical protein